MTAKTPTRYCIHGTNGREVCLLCGDERDLYDPRRLWEAKQLVEGNCIICGDPKGKSPYKRKCIGCGPKAAVWRRKKFRSKKWKQAGDRGRPPLLAEVQ